MTAMTDFDEYDDSGPVDSRPSKSRLKREKKALQDLGKQIADLPTGHYVRIPLSAPMQEAMALYRRLNSHEAKRRQLQFIGKHMHDENLDEIRAAFELIDSESRLFRQHFRKLEQMRDLLVEEGDSALETVLDEFPHLNRQEIRQLIRQAAKEKRENKPPAASRKLFRYLRDHTEILPQ